MDLMKHTTRMDSYNERGTYKDDEDGSVQDGLSRKLPPENGSKRALNYDNYL